jgi:hypothetical protein
MRIALLVGRVEQRDVSRSRKAAGELLSRLDTPQNSWAGASTDLTTLVVLRRQQALICAWKAFA